MYNGYTNWATWECMNHFQTLLEDIFGECDGDEEEFERRAAGIVEEIIDGSLRDCGLNSPLLELAASTDLIDYEDIFNTLED